MRVLAFAASLRRGSLNRTLIQVAARIAREEGARVDLAELRALETPLYRGCPREPRRCSAAWRRRTRSCSRTC